MRADEIDIFQCNHKVVIILVGIECNIVDQFLKDLNYRVMLELL